MIFANVVMAAASLPHNRRMRPAPRFASQPPLILASTSRYRAELVARLGLRWEVHAPGVCESRRAGELPPRRAERLAEEKARAVAMRVPAGWVLGGDQVCACGEQVLDKPGTLDVARQQLRSLAGQRVEFHTAICLVRAQPAGCLAAVDHTVVHFRCLGEEEIERYLAAEAVLDCAGSFKCEGLGISLCEAIETRDPTALIGVPLIALRRLLAEAGVSVP